MKGIKQLPQTSRELVTSCLKFENPLRIPRQTWILSWTEKNFPKEIEELHKQYPDDIIECSSHFVYRPSSRSKGDRYLLGKSTDEWGCVFENLQEVIMGEVKDPLIKDISDWKKVKPPYEILPDNFDKARDIINQFCAKTELFVVAGSCPRPWERMQFLRGTVNTMMDIMMPEKGAIDLLKLIHDFYLKELEFWVKTDVDAIFFMDDWGAQSSLLISPTLWQELFKPLYKDYCDLAHAHGKFAFMHSDGCIFTIYEDLIEVGVDAINSQLFTMDMKELAKKAKGKITFWGEIDRQYILTSKEEDVVRNAVRQVAKHLYDPRGGIIAQFEFGPGIFPKNAKISYD